MMKKVRKIGIITLVLLLSMPHLTVKAATENPITVKEYIELLTNSLQLDSTKFPKTKIDGNKKITKQDAAVLANQAEELLHGVIVLTDDSPEELSDQVRAEEKQYDRIIKFNRIKDLNNIPAEKRPDVIKIFQKGIMTGTGNGTCSQDRTFHGTWLVSKEEAKEICDKIADKKLQSKMSPDGQVIRTTNLPKNYKKFSYILESFPNSFYEKRFVHERAIYYASGGKTRNPIEYKDYVLPVNMKNDTSYRLDFPTMADHFLDDWIKKAETNLYQRFNVDYRTVDQKWINTLWKTYYQYDDYAANDSMAMDTRKLNSIKNYVSEMKKNKIVIQSSRISVEPSSLYDAVGYRFRVYVRFKVSAINTVDSADDIFYSNFIDIADLKKGVWMEKYFEIEVGTANGNSTGDDFAVFGDDLMDIK